MIRRWFKGMLWISRYKYFLITEYVYLKGVEHGYSQGKIAGFAEANKGAIILGRGDYKKAVAEAERIVRGQ